MNRSIIAGAFCLLFVFAAAQTSSAEDSSTGKYQLGFHAGISLSGGEPFNDAMLAGLYGKYRLNDKWKVTMGIDYLQYDYEAPAYLLNLAADKVIDGAFSEYIISVGAERDFEKMGNRVTPFVLGGLGIGIVNEEVVSGNLLPSGTYSATTDAGTEFIPNLGAGLRFATSDNTSFEWVIRGDYHIADWTITDSVSGNTAKIDDYFAYGTNIGFVYTF